MYGVAKPNKENPNCDSAPWVGSSRHVGARSRRRDSSSQSAIAPRGVREIQASRRSEPGERVSGCADTLQVGARRMHVELGLGDHDAWAGNSAAVDEPGAHGVPPPIVIAGSAAIEQRSSPLPILVAALQPPP